MWNTAPGHKNGSVWLLNMVHYQGVNFKSYNLIKMQNTCDVVGSKRQMLYNVRNNYNIFWHITVFAFIYKASFSLCHL